MLGEIIKERYLVKSVINESPLSNSYMVSDIQLDKPFVLKMISFTPDDIQELPKFKKQVLNFKQHYHPQIPKIHDVFTVGEDFRPQLCLISDPIKGESLSNILKDKRRFEELETIELLLQLSRIIEYLHSLMPPFIHQAIQPDNLLLTEDKKLYLTGYSLTREDENGKEFPLNMSLDYTSEEQMRGEPSPLSDVYGMGSTAIEMVTGKKVSQIADGDFYSQANISIDFANLLKKMIKDEQDLRPPSATALKNNLITLRNNILDQQKEINIDAKLEKKQMVIPVLAGLAAVIGITGFGIKAYFFQPPPEKDKGNTHISRSSTKNHKFASKKGHLSLKNGSFTNGMPLTVGFKNASQKQRDWISISPANTEDNNFETQLFLNGESKGSINYQLPKRPGDYEVRYYQNWPAAGYQVQDRLAFKVTGSVDLPNANTSFESIQINPFESFTYTEGIPPGIETKKTGFRLRKTPLETLSFEPTYTTKALYGSFYFGNSEDAIITYAVADNKIYLDLNNNQDLSDDKALDLPGGVVKFQHKLLDMQQIPIDQPYLMNLAYTNGYGINAQNSGYYIGDVSFAGKTVQALVYEDKAIDGLYRNNGVWLDINENKTFESDERYAHNDTLSFDNNRYQVKLIYP